MGDRKSLVSGLNCTLLSCHGSQLTDFIIVAINVYASDGDNFETAFPNIDYKNQLCQEDNTVSYRNGFARGFGFYRSIPLKNQLQCNFKGSLMFAIACLVAGIFIPACAGMFICKFRKMKDIKAVLPPGLNSDPNPVKNEVDDELNHQDDDYSSSDRTIDTVTTECSTLTGKEYNYRIKDLKEANLEKISQQYISKNKTPIIENIMDKSLSGYIRIDPPSGYIKVPPNIGGYVTCPIEQPRVSFFYNCFMTK